MACKNLGGWGGWKRSTVATLPSRLRSRMNPATAACHLDSPWSISSEDPLVSAGFYLERLPNHGVNRVLRSHTAPIVLHAIEVEDCARARAGRKTTIEGKKLCTSFSEEHAAVGLGTGERFAWHRMTQKFSDGFGPGGSGLELICLDSSVERSM